MHPSITYGLPRLLSGKDSACQCGRPGFDPWVGKIPWRRKWQPTPVFLPGQSHGPRSRVGYSSWGLKESDTTERHIRTYIGTNIWMLSIRMHICLLYIIIYVILYYIVYILLYITCILYNIYYIYYVYYKIYNIYTIYIIYTNLCVI